MGCRLGFRHGRSARWFRASRVDRSGDGFRCRFRRLLTGNGVSIVPFLVLARELKCFGERTWRPWVRGAASRRTRTARAMYESASRAGFIDLFALATNGAVFEISGHDFFLPSPCTALRTVASSVGARPIQATLITPMQTSSL